MAVPQGATQTRSNIARVTTEHPRSKKRSTIATLPFSSFSSLHQYRTPRITRVGSRTTFFRRRSASRVAHSPHPSTTHRTSLRFPSHLLAPSQYRTSHSMCQPTPVPDMAYTEKSNTRTRGAVGVVPCDPCPPSPLRPPSELEQYSPGSSIVYVTNGHRLGIP
eukprot:3067229-Rhodomonas_salina.1